MNGIVRKDDPLSKLPEDLRTEFPTFLILSSRRRRRVEGRKALRATTRLRRRLLSMRGNGVFNRALRTAHRPTKLPDVIPLATALETGHVAPASDDRRMPVPASMPLVHLGPDSLRPIKELAS